ncbi:hypothetical protein EYF80_033865 [Liparis tanakae]|uniref:Uncharacterized protein n=1 Tax=Liparis tanakae TaxID=230148 RepID=A0A4Z2GRA3_9TELE|nr:hypothetical protein EYF80_033865 [Liparis tanakae]
MITTQFLSNRKPDAVVFSRLAQMIDVRIEDVVNRILGLRDCYDPTRVVVVFLSEKKLLSKTT